MRKIILFTDSLGRPRPDLSENERTEYEDVYGYKIREHFSDDWVELLYVESLDTDDAIFWNERMVAFKRPDIVVYQIGINDCAARIFKKNSRSIILKPWFRKASSDIVLRLITKYRSNLLKILPNKTYINKHLFRNNFIRMIADVKTLNSNCRFFCLSITGQPYFKEKKSPGITQNVKVYNEVLHQIFMNNFLDIDAILKMPPDKYLISDGVHLEKHAHEIIAHALIKRIEQIGLAEQCAE